MMMIVWCCNRSDYDDDGGDDNDDGNDDDSDGDDDSCRTDPSYQAHPNAFSNAKQFLCPTNLGPI